MTSTAPPRTLQQSLIGQMALVTGANSGIGRTVAVALGQAGANVLVNYIVGDEAAADVVREIESYEVEAYAHKADVASAGEVWAMFAAMIAQFDTIDILVVNAGLRRDSAGRLQLCPRGYGRGIKCVAMSQHCPGNARKLVCQRYDNSVLVHSGR